MHQKGAGAMSKFWSRLLWFFVFAVVVAYIVLWLLPTPQSEGDATPEEREQVVAQIQQIADLLPQEMRLDKIKTHRGNVVEVNIVYTDRASAPDTRDRTAWANLADEVAVFIATEYLPEGWHVNVVMWYKKSPLSSSLPYGLAGRSAGEEPEGGPAYLFR